MRRTTWLGLASILVSVFLGGGRVLAQPLVTGNLTIYYDFDEIVENGNLRQFPDESGNNLPGTIFEGDLDIDLEPGTLTLDTENARRGAGAARFSQSPIAEDLPVYIDIDGARITNELPDLLPTSGLNDQYGFTVAAWLNVTANDMGDQSVFQARTSDGGHGAPHFQLQGNGKLRMTFRNQTSGTVVDAPQKFTDGSDFGDPYPVDEWFHYVGTYDAELNFWEMYYNGELIAEGEGTGEDLGDWGGQPDNFFAAGIGAVYDSGGRRLNGMIDEFYLFNRRITAEEAAMLANPPAAPALGDCNGDGVLDATDLKCVATVDARNAVLAEIGSLPGDLDGDGTVAFPDFLVLSANFGKAGLGYAEGNIDLADTIAFPDFLVLSANFGKAAASAATVPEPSSHGLLVASLMLVGLARSRRAIVPRC